MTEFWLTLLILVLVLPAVVGWGLFLLALYGGKRAEARQQEREAQTDAWVRAYNAQLVERAAARHTAATRKRELRKLRLVTGGNASRGTPGWPPRAA